MLEFNKRTYSDIENLVAVGKDSYKDIAELLNVKYQALYARINRNKEIKKEVNEAIARGKIRQSKFYLEITEKEIRRRIEGYAEEEEQVEIQYGPNSVIIAKKVKITKKNVKASDMLLIWTAVNASRETGKWESINRVEDKKSNSLKETDFTIVSRIIHVNKDEIK